MLLPLGFLAYRGVFLRGRHGRRPFRRSVAPAERSNSSHLVVPRVNLVRRGCIEPFLDVRPTLSSSDAQWSGFALESYETPAVSIHDHEHPEHFLHMVVSGTSIYEVKTRGRSLRFTASPGTMFLLPRGTIDEVLWANPPYGSRHSSTAVN